MKMKQSTKYFILGFGLFEIFIFTGSILGWTGLENMLIKQRVYRNLCPIEGNETEPQENITIIDTNSTKDKYDELEVCDEQKAMLSLAFTIGSFCLGATAFAWGFLLERWGLRIIRIIINILLTTGNVLLSITDENRSYLLIPAIVLMCFAGIPLRISNLQIAELFPKQRSSVITLYSGAFGASTAVFIILEYLNNAGVPFGWVISILIFLSLLKLPVTFYMLPPMKIEDTGQISLHKIPEDDFIAEVAGIYPPVFDITTPRKSSVVVLPISWQPKPTDAEIKPKLESETTTEVSEKNPKTPSVKDPTSKEPSELTEKNLNNLGPDVSPTSKVPNELSEKCPTSPKSPEQNVAPTSKEPNSNPLPEKKPISLPITSSFFSNSYMMHQYWFCWLLLFSIIYVGNFKNWSERTFKVKDAEEGKTIMAVYGITQLLGIFLAPIGGLFMDWTLSLAATEQDPDKRRLKEIQANVWPIGFTTLIAFVIQICLFFETATAMWVSVFFVTILRMCILSFGTAFIRVRYPPDHFGRLLGIMSTVSAIVVLLNYPLFLWANTSRKGAYQVLIFETICLCFACAHPILILITPFQTRQILQEKHYREEYERHYKAVS